MRILYWADSWWPAIGGIEVLGGQCVRRLRNEGFEVLVVTAHWDDSRPDVEEHEGVEIHRFRFPEALQGRRLDLFARTVQDVRRLKRAWQPDILHLHFPSPSGIFHLRTADACSARLLLAMHTHVPDWKTGAETLSRRLLLQSDWVTANSAATMELARAADGGISGRSSVIHNGLADPAVPPTRLDMHPPVVACAGRLVFKKGIDALVAAMVRVREAVPAVRLLVAGDGPERARLERQAGDLGLDGCVEFRGWVEPNTMSAFLNEATLLAVPSRSMEPFGNVAVEAMQMGRPVVATRLGGLAEVVADGETGFVVDPDDPAAMARRIVALLSDPATAERMGEAGRARAQRLFGIDRYVRDYARLYRDLAR